jgi:phosphoglycolate phosphatase
LPEGCDSTTIAECVALMRQEYANRWAATTRPYEGIPELLDALTTRSIPMAVLSNKVDEFTKLCVSRLLADWHFTAALGASHSLPRKPDPAGAWEVARRLHVASREVVYLGDTNTDMATAVAAGMFPVGALWGFRTADELVASGAKALIEKPMDLLRILDDRDCKAGQTD